MATKKIKGWVPKDESSEETIRGFVPDVMYDSVEEASQRTRQLHSEFKQVEITLTCKDVKEKKK